MLLKEGKIDKDFITRIMCWRYTSGIRAHKGEQLGRDDRDWREALAQYVIRNPFSVEKIHYQHQSGTVIYKSKVTHGKENF